MGCHLAIGVDEYTVGKHAGWIASGLKTVARFAGESSNVG